MMQEVRMLGVPTYKVDAEHYYRFNQRRTVFGRMLYDTQTSFFGHRMYERCNAIRTEHRDGYARVERWAADHDRCYEFWVENGSDCSNCIAARPCTHAGME